MRKASEEVRVGHVRFLGEQDGPAEAILKDKLVDLFRHHKGTSRAYLARVDFAKGTIGGVVLAIRTQTNPDRELIEKIGSIFASVFDAREKLDIMFLTDDQENQLVKVCKPFFVQIERQSQ